MSEKYQITGARGRARRALAVLCGALVLGGLVVAAAVPAVPVSASSVAGPRSGAARIAQLARAARREPQAACPAARRGEMRCFVLEQPQYAVNQALAAGKTTKPRGWTARQLERAYRLPVSRRPNQTVAVSIAFHTPDLGRYLATYRQRFGLPACGRGCFRVVDQRGQAKVTAPSGVGSGWDLEATLDVSMVSAACPHCKILVVEGNSPSSTDLAATEDTAARLGAPVISNSYGIRESGLSQTMARSYRHPGHVIVASSGDSGFDAANFPANLATVTAVGGTELSRARDARGFTERVWNQPLTSTTSPAASTSSCSAYVAKPAWQHDRHCSHRTIADISAVAENIPIFNRAWGGWITVGGTSVAAPLTAGIYGLAGNAAKMTVRDLYQHAGRFFDVTKGNNLTFGDTPKRACGGDYLCTAKRGYDAPTGLGTPNGLGAF